MQKSYFSENKCSVNLASRLSINVRILQIYMRHKQEHLFARNEDPTSFKLPLSILLLFFVVFLISCTENKQDNPIASADQQMFVGTWNLVGIRSVSEQGDIYDVPPEEIEADPLTYVLRSDGSGTLIYQGSLIDFIWMVQGDKFIAISQGGYQEYLYIVSSKSLTLTFKILDDETGGFFNVTHKFGRYEEIPQVELGNLERVPVFNSTNPNDQILTVTVSPSPLPSEEKITLDISTIGTGLATFEDGSFSMEITKSSVVKIRGFINSNQKDDITISGLYQGTEIATEKFTVRTYPISFEIINVTTNTPSDGRLIFEYNIISESGDVDDLLGIILGEWVDYPGSDIAYYFSSPPYRIGPFLQQYWTQDPYINSKVFGSDALKIFPDVHKLPTDDENHPLSSPDEAFRKEYRTDAFEAIQYYWFRDLVLMDQSTRVNIHGPNIILREVDMILGVWMYRITKTEGNESYSQTYILPE
jgi:hypothetical protein